MTELAVESEGLRKEFGADDRILTGADLRVREGEILMLMGPNGVGKTVLLSCLAGSERPTEGQVRVFGEDIGAGRDDLEFLLQDSVAVERLTGRENVSVYADLHPRFTDRWREYVERLGIAAELDKLVEHYSEGMKRKLEFSLAMSGDSRLYLLDEPTAGVDLRNVQRFHDIIFEHNQAGKTFVVSSHRPIDANVADRIAFMPDGSISVVDTPAALIERVPEVVTISGRETIAAAEDFVVGGELFPVGGEARGFLGEDVSASDLEDAIDATGETVESIQPTYTDLYNYYVHVTEAGSE